MQKKRAYGPQPMKFTPQNISKYKGNVSNIISRSSLETQFMRWCDLCSSIVEWSSEETVIPYLDPTRPLRDGTPSKHRYIVDFYIKVKKSDGSLQKILVEIKPASQAGAAPERGKKTAKVFNEACETWIRNQSKWKYAKTWAEGHGMKFMVLTEKNFKTL
jgi:hypothetical protein